MSKNDSSSLVIGGVILLAIGGGVYYYMTHKTRRDGHPDLPATPTPSIMGALGTAVGQPAPAPFGVSVPPILPGTPNPLPPVSPPRDGFGVRYPVPVVGNPAITGGTSGSGGWTVAGRKAIQPEPSPGSGFGVRAPGILAPPQYWPKNEYTLPYEPPMYEAASAEAVGV